MEAIIYILIYGGSAIMLFNIIGFFYFAHSMSKRNPSRTSNVLFFIPAILVTLFFLGYLGVAIWGKPDWLVAAILFGGAVYVLVMWFLLRKITKRVEENEALKAKLMATEESHRAKTNFLSDISHEMRTPLNVILGLNTMALKDPSLEKQTRERLLHIRANAESLLAMVNSIIDMNSIESGELALKNEEFSLEATIEHFDAIVESAAKQKGIVYQCNLPDSVKGFYIGDENRLAQVLFSLLDNAVKYTDQGGKITLDIRGEQGKVIFVVSDTGQGMDQEFLNKAFEVFAKEESGLRTGHSGSGLGLAVTKGIVSAMGGTIEAQSQKGVGSTFTVILPLQKRQLTQEEISLEGKRILVVEDIPDNAEIVMDLLDLEGAVCEHAQNGRVAVDMFSASAPGYYDVILMDLRMPVMDGLTASKEIRKMEREDAKVIPIVALTANAFESDVRESLAAGMDAHVSKPADTAKLYATIKMVLAKKAGQ